MGVELKMAGRKALITGGSMGLGRAMAVMFAQAGAEVTVVARRAEGLESAKAEITGAGGKAHAVAGDVSTADGCAKIFAAAEKAMGQVDILVNNAGESKTGKFETLTDEIWQADFDLKVFAAIRLARLALPGMKQRNWGRIVNVLNTGAKSPGGATAPTSVSRAAGMALTKVLSHEGAPHNVLVNALMTGLIKSDQHVRRHKREAPEMPYEEFLASRAKSAGLAIGRYGEADEFAAMACFLCSDAGGYINGTAINVDGGRSPVV